MEERPTVFEWQLLIPSRHTGLSLASVLTCCCTSSRSERRGDGCGKVHRQRRWAVKGAGRDFCRLPDQSGGLLRQPPQLRCLPLHCLTICCFERTHAGGLDARVRNTTCQCSCATLSRTLTQEANTLQLSKQSRRQHNMTCQPGVARCFELRRWCVGYFLNYVVQLVEDGHVAPQAGTHSTCW